MLDASGKEEARLLIQDAKSGDPAALNQLFALLQPELQRIAKRLMSKERHFTHYNPTGSGLVHDLLLQMLQGDSKALPQEIDDESELLGLAAFRMSRILADNARIRDSLKRKHERAPLEAADYAGFNIGTSEEPMLLNNIAVNRAFSKLEREFPKHARLLQLCVATGLTIEETAELLGMSRSTAVRDKRFALTYLRTELS